MDCKWSKMVKNGQKGGLTNFDHLSSISDEFVDFFLRIVSKCQQKIWKIKTVFGP